MSLDKLIEKAASYQTPEDIEEKEKLRLSFTTKFPQESLKTMTIDEYSHGTGKDSFSYWLEFKKNILFGIGGGNASKFGLYKATDRKYYTGSGKKKRELSGQDLTDHFENLKAGILQALAFTQEDEIENVKDLNLPIWNMVLMKILALYYPNKFLMIGSPDVLLTCAHDIGLQNVELSNNNSIQINYACKKALSQLDTFKGWPYEKLGRYIWKTYHEQAKRNYYILGSKYGGGSDVDVFPKMLEQSVVSTNYANHLNLESYFQKSQSEITAYLQAQGEESKSYSALKYFLNLQVGDHIAIKADGSPKKSKGFISIIGVAEVIEKNGKIYEYDPKGLGHTIHVKFIHAPVYKEFEIGGYRRTIHKLSNPEHVNVIFNGDFERDYQIAISFKNFLKQFEESALAAYFSFLREISKKFNLQPGDQKLVFSIRENRLNFTVGQRYCFNLYAADQRGKFGVISSRSISKLSKLYEGSGPSAYYNFFEKFEPSQEEKESIFEAIEVELNKTKKSGFRKHNNTDFENYVFQVSPIKELTNMHFPLNTIFYGPPGTGKTYNTILRAAQIIENREIESYDEALNIFKENLHIRIEFITFHQNYSYEDFIQGLRPETDNKSSLLFEKKDGVFKRIADRALENLKLSKKAPEELSNEVLFEQALEKFIDAIQEQEDHYPINDTAYIFEVEEDAFRYTGDKWTSYINGLRMKFKDLKEFHRNQVTSRKDIKKLTSVSGLAIQHATYYFLVYEQIMQLLPASVETPQPVREENFVIIIDEINRANISRVFGELITLIEPEKRSHGAIPLEARLPSGDPFIVPSNLYIIGTMNTADKSIALLDIALRRRFEFEAMYPKYEIKGKVIYEVDILKKINELIIKSKGHDFQIGHAYFMGENKDLVKRMNNKVIPLLMEYYMNDEKEVKSILAKAGLQIEENSWPLRILGRND